MLLNNERTGKVGHKTAHFGFLPPFWGKEEPRRQCPTLPGKDRSKTPNSSTLLSPYIEETKVGEWEVHKDSGSLLLSMPPSQGSGATHYAELCLWDGGRAGLGAAGAESKSSKQVFWDVRGKEKFTFLLSVRWTGKSLGEEALFFLNCVKILFIYF